MLPDDVLLVIFDFCVACVRNQDIILVKVIKLWQLLIHMCRRWWAIVFGSPHQLNIQLVCTPGRPARQSLDVWLALDLLIKGTISSASANNIIFALGQSICVHRVNLVTTGGLQWDKVLASMQVPFPELTYLDPHSYDETLPVIPNTFLGGSTPQL